MESAPSCGCGRLGSSGRARGPSSTENGKPTSPPVKVGPAPFAKNCVAVVALELPAQLEPINPASWFSKNGCASGVCPAASAAATASYACANVCFDAGSTKKYGAELKFTPCGSRFDHRPVQPISTIMLPGISRWIVRSAARLLPILVEGSSWKLNSSPKGALGTTGVVVTAGTVGTGRFPSTPTRKDAAPGLLAVAPALQPGPGVPEALHSGAPTLTVCANPTPSMGMITLWTVFVRS